MYLTSPLCTKLNVKRCNELSNSLESDRPQDIEGVQLQRNFTAKYTWRKK